jgi:uncharacterized protein YdaU (DUF1376 family)
VNYYKRHIGDYARDTGHLSALEHGIYGLLLDWYYVNERPIPDDKANRIAKANRTETESVLTDFFKLTPSGWAHSRADREIAEYQARAETNRVTGRLGGRPKKNPNGYESVSETKPNGTLATNHKPVTKESKSKEKAVAPRGARLPADWKPSEADIAYAVTKGVDWKAEAENFADFWHAKAGKDACKTDWGLTWKTWIRRCPATTSSVVPIKSAKQALAPSETKLERDIAWVRRQYELGQIDMAERDDKIQAATDKHRGLQ